MYGATQWPSGKYTRWEKFRGKGWTRSKSGTVSFGERGWVAPSDARGRYTTWWLPAGRPDRRTDPLSPASIRHLRGYDSVLAGMYCRPCGGALLPKNTLEIRLGYSNTSCMQISPWSTDTSLNGHLIRGVTLIVFHYTDRCSWLRSYLYTEGAQDTVHLRGCATRHVTRATCEVLCSTVDIT